MSIKWNKSSRFKPEVVLKRIAAVRTRTPGSKGSSFSGWELDLSMPSLHSMLQFPEAAQHVDHATLIWKAVSQDPDELTKDSFLKEINRQLSATLSQRDEHFRVLTSLSLQSNLKLGTITIDGVRLHFSGRSYPRKFIEPRSKVIQSQSLPVTEDSQNYSKVVANVIAKNPANAITLSIRSIDLYRSLWCLFCNAEMELLGQSWIPINSVRLGAIHSVHHLDGSVAIDSAWFEPHHISTSPHTPKDLIRLKGRVLSSLKAIKRCPYSEAIHQALLMYVRALDEWNQTTAFTKLWSALERLTSPGRADYDAVVRRCCVDLL